MSDRMEWVYFGLLALLLAGLLIGVGYSAITTENQRSEAAQRCAEIGLPAVVTHNGDVLCVEGVQLP